MPNRILIYVQDGVVERVVADTATEVYIVDLDVVDETHPHYAPGYHGNLYPLGDVAVSATDTRLAARTWETV
jgi:hypothetical protein